VTLLPKKKRSWLQKEFDAWSAGMMNTGELAPYKDNFYCYLVLRDKALSRITDTIRRALLDSNYNMKVNKAKEIAKLTGTAVELWHPGGDLTERKVAIDAWRRNR
jgi:hypothetical protein